MAASHITAGGADVSYQYIPRCPAFIQQGIDNHRPFCAGQLFKQQQPTGMCLHQTDPVQTLPGQCADDTWADAIVAEKW